MVKKHAKPSRKTPAAGKGKSASRKPAGKKTPAKKPAAKKHAATKRAATKHAATKKKPAPSRKPAAKAPAGKAARPPAPKSRTASKPGVAVKTTAKAAPPAAKPAKTAPKPDKAVVAKQDKLAGKPDKTNGKATNAAAAAAAAKTPAGRKPSPGEIAARIAGKRAEDAAHKKGKNGKHAEVAPRELTPADVEARKRRLKTLIVLGKERGYLTYAEINDHLPDDILDAEQIEGIISMIGDMGIQVYDEAPDAETLLMSEAPADRARRGRRGGSRSRRVDARLRIRPHHRSGAHVHARDGLGRAPDARRRDRDRQADRGGSEAHDPGDLRMPDDGRADPRPRRQDRQGRAQDRRRRRRPARLQRAADADRGRRPTRSRTRKTRPTPGVIAEREPRAAARSRRWSASARSASTSRGCSRVLQKEGHKAPKYLDLQKKISGRADADPLLGAHGREAVRLRAHRGRQHPPASSARSRTSSCNKGGMPRPGFHQERSRPTRRRCAGSTARSPAHHNFSEQLAQVPAGDRRAAAEAPRPADARDDPA